MTKRKKDTLCFAIRRLGKAWSKLIGEVIAVLRRPSEKLLEWLS